MRRLSSLDNQFLAMENGRVHAHICQLTILEARTASGELFSAQTIQDLILSRLALATPLTWKLQTVPFSLDYPLLVEDENLNIEDHIWEEALPPGGGDRELGELVARIASRPLDRARPLWEVYVIHGLPDDEVAMVTKLHHALVDGVAGVRMMGAFFDQTPDAGPPEDLPEPEPEPRVSDFELLIRGVTALPRQATDMVRAIPPTLRNLDQVASMRALPGSDLLSGAADLIYRTVNGRGDGYILERTAGRAPQVSFGGKISAHRRFAFGALDFGTVRAIKESREGFTINDVVVAVVAGALRRRMLARGDDVDVPLVALIPFAVRDDDSEHGNQISSMMVNIPTDESDPEIRLERAHAVMATAKSRHGAMPAKLVQEANKTVPPLMFGRVARALSTTTAYGWIDPPFNVTISNLPGSRVPLFCGGAEVLAQYPVNVLLDGVGVSITLLSYQDRIDFGVTVDRDLLPEVWDLEAEVVEALDELAAVMGVDL